MVQVFHGNRVHFDEMYRRNAEMKVKTFKTDSVGLQSKINEIGYENVLEILPYHSYYETLYIIIYKG